MNPEDLKLLAMLAFGAGGAWFFIKQSRKDVNGLGSKVRDHIDETNRRHINVCLALMLTAPDAAAREKIADLMKEPK